MHKRGTKVTSTGSKAKGAVKPEKDADKAGTICRAIRRAIVERALRPGDRLPEDALGERFGVSRTIARHALG